MVTLNIFVHQGNI